MAIPLLSNIRRVVSHILLILTVFFIAIFVLRDSFRLSLYGDDWYALYIFIFQSGPAVGRSYLEVQQYLSPYGPTALFMGLIYIFFGFNPLPYFIVSFLSRMFLVSAIYLFVYLNTQKKLAAFGSALFFAVSEIGLGTTNWVFNFNTYLGGALFLLSLIIYNSSRASKNFKKLFISILLFSLSVVTVPVRMHGAFIFMIFNELWLYLRKKSPFNLRMSIAMSFVWIIIFVYLIKINVFGDGNFNIYVINSLKSSLEAIKLGRTDHILYPFTTFGNLIFTDKLIETGIIHKIISSFFKLSSLQLLPVTLWVSLTLIVSLISQIFNVKSHISFFLSLFWTLIIIFFINTNPNTFNNIDYVFLTFIGGFFILILIEIILLTWKQNRKLSQSIIYSTIFFWSFAAVPLLYSPFSHISSSMRYLTLPGISLAFLVDSLLSYQTSSTRKYIIYLLIFFLFLIQIFSSQKYLARQSDVRNAKISNKIWGQILQKTPKLSSEKQSLFYIEPTNKNMATFIDVVTLGFAGVLVLNGEVSDKVGGPYLLITIKDLESALTDGESMKAYTNGEPKVFNWDQVYAYRLTDDFSVIDIKDEIREKLVSEKQLKDIK